MRCFALAFVSLCLAAFNVEARAEDRIALRNDVRARVPAAASGVARIQRAPCHRWTPEKSCGFSRRWAFSLEAGVSRFPSPDGAVGVPTGNPAQFRWSTLDYSFAPSFRIGARYTLTARDTLYLRAAWNGATDDRFTRTGVVGFTPTPGGAGATTPAGTATFRSEAESQTGEIGWWRRMHACCPWRIDVGAALRIFHFHEPVRADWTAPFPGVGGLPQIRSLGHNLFFGLQPGAAVTYTLARTIDVFAKAKVFAGGMVQDLEVSDRNVFSAGAHTADRDRFTFAWGADVEIGARWHLNRCWSLTASYNLFFFDSVVRGFDAFDFSRSATSAVQSRFQESTLLLHYLYVGAIYRL